MQEQSRNSVLPAILALVVFAGLSAVLLWAERGQNRDHASAVQRENEVTISRRLAATKYRGEAEYHLDDGTRVDILGRDFAYECEWAHAGKIYEAVGQSLYYSIKTRKKPAIILLLDDPPANERYVDRCRLICNRAGVTLFTEDVSESSRRSRRP